MNKRGRQILFVNPDLCTGCGSCEVACQLEHGLPAGVRPIRVLRVGPFETDDGLLLRFYPTTCSHCAQPACVQVCPQSAMQQRPDGVVFSDLNRCIGCQTCAIACPHAAPQLNTLTGKIAKCDSCMARLDKGLLPACVLKCPTGALTFGLTHRLIQWIQRREAERVLTGLPLQETVLRALERES